MVDEDRLRRLLDRVRTDVDHLADLTTRPVDRLTADVIAVSGLKYLFIRVRPAEPSYWGRSVRRAAAPRR